MTPSLGGQVGQVGQEALRRELGDDEAVELEDVGRGAGGDGGQQLVVRLGVLVLGDVRAVDLDVRVLALKVSIILLVMS